MILLTPLRADVLSVPARGRSAEQRRQTHREHHKNVPRKCSVSWRASEKLQTQNFNCANANLSGQRCICSYVFSFDMLWALGPERFTIVAIRFFCFPFFACGNKDTHLIPGSAPTRSIPYRNGAPVQARIHLVAPLRLTVLDKGGTVLWRRKLAICMSCGSDFLSLVHCCFTLRARSSTRASA